jgi:hypothetical protein
MFVKLSLAYKNILGFFILFCNISSNISLFFLYFSGIILSFLFFHCSNFIFQVLIETTIELFKNSLLLLLFKVKIINLLIILSYTFQEFIRAGAIYSAKVSLVLASSKANIANLLSISSSTFQEFIRVGTTY